MCSAGGGERRRKIWSICQIDCSGREKESFLSPRGRTRTNLVVVKVEFCCRDTSRTTARRPDLAEKSRDIVSARAALEQYDLEGDQLTLAERLSGRPGQFVVEEAWIFHRTRN